MLAKILKFKSAWTNEAFELCYLLHYIYLDADISRHNYIEKLEAEICKYMGFEKYEYKKNDPNIYNILNETGSEKFAKECARKLRSLFEDDKDYKEHKPCTHVDLLVNELENPEKLLKE